MVVRNILLVFYFTVKGGSHPVDRDYSVVLSSVTPSITWCGQKVSPLFQAFTPRHRTCQKVHAFWNFRHMGVTQSRVVKSRNSLDEAKTSLSPDAAKESEAMPIVILLTCSWLNPRRPNNSHRKTKERGQHNVPPEGFSIVITKIPWFWNGLTKDYLDIVRFRADYGPIDKCSGVATTRLDSNGHWVVHRSFWICFTGPSSALSGGQSVSKMNRLECNKRVWSWSQLLSSSYGWDQFVSTTFLTVTSVVIKS